MRKIFVSINAAAITFVALFVWSHGLATTPLKANRRRRSTQLK